MKVRLFIRNWILFISWLVSATGASGQDMGWLLDQAPLVSGIMAQLVEKTPSFTAGVEVTVTGPRNSVPSTALGQLRSSKGRLAWHVKLSDIKAAPLTPTARSLVKQINGERLLVLTRLDDRSNYLVLAGAKSYLQQPFPGLKLSAPKVQPGNVILDGRKCVREKRIGRDGAGRVVEVSVWKSKENKNVPVQVEVAEAGEVFQIRLKDVRLQALREAEFAVPAGLSKYDSIEDLTQSIVLDRMKRRLGLE